MTANENIYDECPIPRSALLRVLAGVAVATKTPRDHVAPLEQKISSSPVERLTADGDISIVDQACGKPNQLNDSFFLEEWRDFLSRECETNRLQQIGTLALGVAYLRQHSRTTAGAPVPSGMMTTVWGMICDVLTNPKQDPPLCTAARSAQGFYSIALCSLITDGNLDELFRIHVWLPDARRGEAGHSVHSHQPFAQSWILVGQGTDVPYTVQRTTNPQLATDAEYVLTWSDGRALNSTYKTHQTVSTVANTGRLVRAVKAQPIVHTRDMTYTVPAAHFHYTDVHPQDFHATFFFFDSSRGFDKDASVLGPIDGTSFTQVRDPGNITAAQLVQQVTTMRSFEESLRSGRRAVELGNWDFAGRIFDHALVGITESPRTSDLAPLCRKLVADEDVLMEQRIRSLYPSPVPDTGLHSTAS